MQNWMSRTPVFPSDWQNQFGLSFEEHRQSMQINVFDGYAVYAIKDDLQNSQVKKDNFSGSVPYDYPSIITVPENGLEGSVNV